MVATVTAAPVVSTLAACTFCSHGTAFSCISCDSPMCPACVRGDFCPECQPARPVAVLMGWSAADEGTEDDAVAAECAGCGDQFFTEDAEEFCPRCSMGEDAVAALRMTPAPERRSCSTCGTTLYGTDGPRCTPCARLKAHLDAKHAAWMAERGAPIAA